MKTLPKILVTGATGKTGGALVRSLLAKGYPVRATVRVKDARSEALAKLGAEIAIADLFDPGQLREAIQGTQRAYYLPPMHPHMLHSATAFAVAASGSSLESIVQMSQWTSAASHPTLMTRQTWLIDRQFAMIPNVAHILFNPGMFAYNYLAALDFTNHFGLFPSLSGDSKSAPISNEDMAEAAAALLIGNPAQFAGKSYRPTGPQLLSTTDMATIVGKVLGRSVKSMPLPWPVFTRVARQMKIDAYSIMLLGHYMEDHRQGTFSFEGGVTQVMEELTGRPAESFETTARRYARALPPKTVSSRLVAWAKFMATPFSPGYDTKGLSKRLALPESPTPTYCMADEDWISTHRAMMKASGARPEKASA